MKVCQIYTLTTKLGKCPEAIYNHKELDIILQVTIIVIIRVAPPCARIKSRFKNLTDFI